MKIEHKNIKRSWKYPAYAAPFSRYGILEILEIELSRLLDFYILIWLAFDGPEPFTPTCKDNTLNSSLS